MNAPLAGIRVVALEQAVSMPFCSFILAELGADVIKVERPGEGDVVRGWDGAVRGLSTGFVAVNGGKRDLAVDLSRPEGRTIVRRLAERADVFLENFAPGVVDRFGLGEGDLKATNPGLIYVSLSGYGHRGPYRDVKAYDLLIQGEAGVLLTNGTQDSPAKVGLPLTDLIGGSTAAIGVLSALVERGHNGRGTHLDISLLEATVSWLVYFPQRYWHTGQEPPRTGMRHQYLCPYGPYLAGDGRYVNLVVASESHWERFCRLVVDRPEWSADPRFCSIQARSENRTALEGLLEPLIATKPSSAWIERLRTAELPYGEVRRIAEVLTHPQLLDAHTFVEATSPVGALPLVRFPLSPPDRERRVPALGEHTAAILAELGYPDALIHQLGEEGVVQ